MIARFMFFYKPGVTNMNPPFHIQEFAEGYGIQIDWASVGHPRTNGQVESANGLILQGLKLRIFDMLKKFTGRWVEELPAVL